VIATATIDMPSAIASRGHRTTAAVTEGNPQESTHEAGGITSFRALVGPSDLAERVRPNANNPLVKSRRLADAHGDWAGPQRGSGAPRRQVIPVAHPRDG
jgi:hypothetical protein